MLDRARRRDGLVGLFIGLLVAVVGLNGGWQAMDSRITGWGMKLASERHFDAAVSVAEIPVGNGGELGDDTGLAESLARAVGHAGDAGASAVAVLAPRGWPLPAGSETTDGRAATTLLLGLPAEPAGRTRLAPRRLTPQPRFVLDSTLSPGNRHDSWQAQIARQLGVRSDQPPIHYLSPMAERDDVGVAGLLPGSEAGRALALARIGDAALPALSVQLAAILDGASSTDIRLQNGDLRIAGRLLPTDTRFHFYPFPYHGQEAALHRVDFEALADGGVDRTELSGRLLVIGPPATARDQASLTERTALHAAAIQAGHVYSQPAWGPWLPWVALVGALLWLTLALPRLNLSAGIYLGLLIAVGLFGLQFLLPTIRLTHLELAMPLMALAAGHSGLIIKRVLDLRQEGMHQALTEANRQLAEALRRQGQTDAAFERLKRCPATGPVLESLYELALDLERRREFARAQGVLRHIEAQSPGFRDCLERIRKLAELETRTALGNRSAGGTLVLPSDGMQRPMLGRYEIERELGRGAMGVVYLGHDPRIGRTVAIKTMALSQEFEGDALEAVTERFFREAETAGRLQHPGIVTIYDVGEEADLAYIAMDFLDGKGLQHYTEPSRLLPATTVCDIVIQVAEALDYAHGRSVVHRDIKPANMIYLPDSKRVVLTDFGVACLTDSRRTKTGTILGTPSYMSPEQVLGRAVDGRSDLFSLGVTLYQMLRGELPFQGEPLATLLYKIANDKTPNVSRGRTDLPPCMGRIIKKALAKKPDERYSSGKEMADALRRCRKEVVARMPGNGSRKKDDGGEASS